jgi:nicotinate-nucleotide adenylyltransferase
VAVALFGGAFDPPHVGHVAVARAAQEQFEPERFIVLVSQRPGHKEVHAPVEARLELARAAFPDADVRLDPYPRTIDLLRAERYDDPIVVIGADQFSKFLTWQEPDAVLERSRIAVATRPGYPVELLDAVLEELDQPEQVVFFEIEPSPVASRDIRALAAAGAPLVGLVPDPVVGLIRERGLYGAD